MNTSEHHVCDGGKKEVKPNNTSSSDQFNKYCAILNEQWEDAGPRNWSALLSTAAILCNYWPEAAPQLAHDLADSYDADSSASQSVINEMKNMEKL